MTNEMISLNYTAHGDDVKDIYNHEIAHGTAIFEYEARTDAQIKAWFEDKQHNNLPVLGLVCAAGSVLGFATFGPYRPRPAYQCTVEHSVYVRADARRQGVGRLLLSRLIERAQVAGYHSMIGVVDASNRGSLALHQDLGFTEVGRLREVGYKFDRRLDTALLQRYL